MTAALLDFVDLTVPGGPVGETWLRLFRPVDAAEPLPVVLYVHDGEQRSGDARVRRLATRLMTDLRVAVVVVDYSLSPKARYPVAIEETYAAAAWVALHGGEHLLDGTRIAVAADPGAAELAAQLMATAGNRGGPALAAHVPVGPRMRTRLGAALGRAWPVPKRSG
ncbi:alpha/beta hydrolase [Dactylosporangium darangshiense]